MISNTQAESSNNTSHPTASGGETPLSPPSGAASTTSLPEAEAAPRSMPLRGTQASSEGGVSPGIAVLNIRDTFPSRNSLIQTFTEQKFNSLLSLIKNRIDNANLINLNYIKMYNIPDLTNYNNDTIMNIRSFLLNNGYFIIELEDISSMCI